VLPRKELHAALDKAIGFTEAQEYILPENRGNLWIISKANTEFINWLLVEIKIMGMGATGFPAKWEDDVSNNGPDDTAPDSSPVLERTVALSDSAGHYDRCT
jgi:hypothetical protein